MWPQVFVFSCSMPSDSEVDSFDADGEEHMGKEGSGASSNDGDEQSGGAGVEEEDEELPTTDTKKGRGRGRGRGRKPKAQVKKKEKQKKANKEDKRTGAGRPTSVKGGMRCSDCGIMKALTEYRPVNTVCNWPCLRVKDNIYKVCAKEKQLGWFQAQRSSPARWLGVQTKTMFIDRNAQIKSQGSSY